MNWIALACAAGLSAACATTKSPNASLKSDPSAPTDPTTSASVTALIDQLEFSNNEELNTPLLSPGVADKSDDYEQRWRTCQEAFTQLSAMKDAAFPVLIQHFDDTRPSIHFRNHVLERSVGYACYMVIYYQMLAHPSDYSSYGYQRQGRDGKSHVKPYHDGTPFDRAGGLVAWLDQNKNLTYSQKQRKALEWALDRERSIGASDVASYYEDIHPLEVAILKRRRDSGEDVADQLKAAEAAQAAQDPAVVPKDMLPAGFGTHVSAKPMPCVQVSPMVPVKATSLFTRDIRSGYRFDTQDAGGTGALAPYASDADAARAAVNWVQDHFGSMPPDVELRIESVNHTESGAPSQVVLKQLYRGLPTDGRAVVNISSTARLAGSVDLYSFAEVAGSAEAIVPSASAMAAWRELLLRRNTPSYTIKDFDEDCRPFLAYTWSPLRNLDRAAPLYPHWVLQFDGDSRMMVDARSGQPWFND